MAGVIDRTLQPIELTAFRSIWCHTPLVAGKNVRRAGWRLARAGAALRIAGVRLHLSSSPKHIGCW